MGPGRHSTVTDAQREELWRRYKAGEAVLWISRELGQRPSNLYRVLQASGGIEPSPRTRSPRVLNHVDELRLTDGGGDIVWSGICGAVTVSLPERTRRQNLSHNCSWPRRQQFFANQARARCSHSK